MSLGAVQWCLVYRAWVKSEEYWPTRWRMLENIKLTLDENHIDIPYQQITVHQAHMEYGKIESLYLEKRQIIKMYLGKIQGRGN